MSEQTEEILNKWGNPNYKEPLVRKIAKLVTWNLKNSNQSYHRFVLYLGKQEYKEFQETCSFFNDWFDHIVKTDNESYLELR